jgi:hypothetical protein
MWYVFGSPYSIIGNESVKQNVAGSLLIAAIIEVPDIMNMARPKQRVHNRINK